MECLTKLGPRETRALFHAGSVWSLLPQSMSLIEVKFADRPSRRQGQH